ncbi:ATG16 family protein [Desemzia sp. C1]|uniref:hypothetical protein n=1 Tax=unclassified Desemzia TaxID=2685243 RepID=UPI001E6123F7|nr:hypothetical protein [Desemzia sp. C1]MCI3027669.1 ATG16 family protein [Desemzia sp. C1]
MNWEVILGIFIGTGGAGSLVSAFLTYKSKQKEHELNLLARAREEIERLDKKVKDLEEENDKKDKNEITLNSIIQDLKFQINELKIIVQKKDNYIDHLKELVDGFKKRMKRGEVE